eukprot:6383631-Amphidinium_carterae.1
MMTTTCERCRLSPKKARPSHSDATKGFAHARDTCALHEWVAGRNSGTPVIHHTGTLSEKVYVAPSKLLERTNKDPKGRLERRIIYSATKECP